MDNNHAQNAMTEIALALAMGFFCIMILALVSMGVGSGSKRNDEAAVDNRPPDSAVLAPSNSGLSSSDRGATEGREIVIFHDGHYIAPDLSPFDPGSISATAKLVLAVDPDLPMTRALAAQQGLSSTDIILSPLSAEWLTRLAHKSP